MKRFTLITLSLVALSAWAGSVRLAWSPNPEPFVGGYVIHVGTNSRAYTLEIPVNGRLTTNGMVTNLTPGLTYFAALTAVTTNGLQSDYSPELFFEMPWLPVRPDKFRVTGFTLEIISNNP